MRGNHLELVELLLRHAHGIHSDGEPIGLSDPNGTDHVSSPVLSETCEETFRPAGVHSTMLRLVGTLQLRRCEVRC